VYSNARSVSTNTPSLDRDDTAIRELPPSAKLVIKVLEYHDTLTQSELAEETLLPARTVRFAVSRLQEAGLIESRFAFTDARKRLHSLRVD